MNNTYILRKIDDLGRIVLPKELRKKLCINPGDDFQIYINNNQIILEKYLKLKDKKEYLLEIINTFSDILNYKILLVIDNIIINNNDNVKTVISNLIRTRKKYINNHIDNNLLGKNTIINGKIIIDPIVIDSDLLGAIIIISNDNIITMENISKIIVYLIKNHLKNN